MTSKAPSNELTNEPFYVKNATDLGAFIRAYRKSQHITLEKVSGLTSLSMRFISELERGKETAELGKALTLLNNLGLEVIIQPRGYSLRMKKSST